MPILRVLRGATDGRRLVWNPEDTPVLSVGRDPSNSLVLSDEHISSFHCELRVQADGQLTARDLGSTNGSRLLGGARPDELRAHQEHPLRLPAHLQLGDPETAVLLGLYADAEQEDEADAAITQVIARAHIAGLDDAEGRLSADHAQLRALYEGLKSLSRHLDQQSVIEAGLSLIFSLLTPATHVSLFLESEASTADHDTRFIPVACQRRDGAREHPRPTSRWLRRRILDERAALLITDLADEIDSSRSLLKAEIHSMIAAPLFVGQRITGIVQVDRRAGQSRPGLAFTQADLECAVVIASHLALAIDHARLYHRLESAGEQLRGENRFLKDRDAEPAHEMIGASSAMTRVLTLIDRVSDANVTVCVIGETGTGKELVARAIHYRSTRRDKLFVAQNCAALPEDLLESELFGHVKGAFTGADASKKGLFELAHGGTIFLDEIGETSAAFQAKLLRVLQEGEVRPVGALVTRRVDVRVISATNRNLEEEVAEGRFREDLYYRLMVFPIHLPPLRDREEDIPLLAGHFMRKYALELGCAPQSLSPAALDLMRSYRWPGNIRELQNELQRLLICGGDGGLIIPDDLSPRIRSIERFIRGAGDDGSGTLKQRMRAIERYILIEALREHDNNKTHTAATLGITREGLHKKLTRFGI